MLVTISIPNTTILLNSNSCAKKSISRDQIMCTKFLLIFTEMDFFILLMVLKPSCLFTIDTYIQVFDFDNLFS